MNMNRHLFLKGILETENNFEKDVWKEMWNMAYDFLDNKDSYILPAGLSDTLFLVKDSVRKMIPPHGLCGDGANLILPQGYKWAAVARKKDIEWEMMKEHHMKTSRLRFIKLLQGFLNKEVNGLYLSDLYKCDERGIYLHKETVFRANENYDEYKWRDLIFDDRKYYMNSYFLYEEGSMLESVHSLHYGDYSQEQIFEWVKIIDEIVGACDDEDYIASIFVTM